MSSASGPRAKGTDGKDFLHRETIASHYSTSSINKSRLKTCVTLHAAIYIFMAARLSVSIFALIGVQQSAFLRQLNFPAAELWEYAWLFSAIPSLFAVSALPKNKVPLMRQAMLGHVIFGLAPLVYAAYKTYTGADGPISLSASSFTLFRWAWVAVSLQVHAFALHFAQQLVGAWQATGLKKKS